MRQATRDRIRIAAGYLLGGSAFIFAAHALGLSGQRIVDGISNIPSSQIVASALCFGIHITFNSAAFAATTRGLTGYRSEYPLALAWLASLMTKYVPGGFWHVVGRGLLLNRLGLSARPVAIGGVLEQLFSTIACVGIAIAALLAWYGNESAGVLVLLLAVVSQVLFLPWVLSRLIRMPDLTALARGSAFYALSMLPFYAGYLVLVRPTDVLNFVFALFGGTLVGLAAVFVPGGLGVRESSIAIMMPETAGPTLGALLLARAVLMICEFLAHVSASLAIRKRERCS